MIISCFRQGVGRQPLVKYWSWTTTEPRGEHLRMRSIYEVFYVFHKCWSEMTIYANMILKKHTKANKPDLEHVTFRTAQYPRRKKSSVNMDCDKRLIWCKQRQNSHENSFRTVQRKSKQHGGFLKGLGLSVTLMSRMTPTPWRPNSRESGKLISAPLFPFVVLLKHHTHSW